MANYLLAYKGGGMAQTDAEREVAMAAWGKWFGELGPAIVDAGNPFGASASVGNGGPSGLTGYSILTAEDLAAATALAQGCPLLGDGGTVEIYETIQVM